MALLMLQDEHEFFGDWRPAGSDRAVSGLLRYRDGRAELNLSDAFTELVGTISVTDESPIYSAVHGVSTKGQAVTLLKALRAGISYNYGSGGVRQTERLVSSWMVIGAHVTEDSKYVAVRYFFPGLAAWLSSKAISSSLSFSADSNDMTQTFVVKTPAPEVIAVPNIAADLEWGVDATVNTSPLGALSVSAHAIGWVEIRPHSPQTIEWYMQQQAKLAALLAYLAGVPVAVSAIEAMPEGPQVSLALIVGIRQSPVCEIDDPRDFFVSQEQLGPVFPEVVRAWFREVESVLVPSQLALSVMSSKGLWAHVEFASLIQALEGFHRGRYSGSYMDDTDYEGVKSVLSNAIPSTVAKDHRDALRSRIRYGNQVSLSKRLTQLRDFLGDTLASQIIAINGKVPRSWIDTRNYHSHWDEELRPRALDGQEMYYANVRMTHFLRALFLLMAGVPADVLQKCLQNTSQTSQHLMQLNIIERHASNNSSPPGC